MVEMREGAEYQKLTHVDTFWVIGKLERVRQWQKGKGVCQSGWEREGRCRRRIFDVFGDCVLLGVRLN